VAQASSRAARILSEAS